MAYFVDVAAAAITGDVDTPARIELPFTTTPNRLFGRLARRTLGNPDNWRSTYEGESVTGGDGSNVTDSDAHGSSSNTREITFTAINQVKTVNWLENTNVADRVGQVQVFANLKDYDTVAGRLACSVDLSIGGVLARSGKVTQPVFAHLSGGAYEAVYLGSFAIPSIPVPANWTWTFKVWRMTGTSKVRLDRLFLLPVDEALGTIDFTSPSDISAASAKKFVYDSRTKRAYYGDLSGGLLVPATYGGLLTLKPGTKNRIILELSADTAWPAPAIPKHPVQPLSGAPVVKFSPVFRR